MIFFCLELFPECPVAENHSRTVVAGGSITEIVYFLGQEDILTAVDITPNYPEEALQLPSIGYVRALSTEGILSLEPTLIMGENDMGPELVVDQIRTTGLDMRIIDDDYSLQSIKNKVFCIGEIIGMKEGSRRIFTEKLGQTYDSLKTIQVSNINDRKRIMVILNIDGTSPIVAGSETSGDGFIKMTGAVNAAGNFKGWKPVGPESIIEMNPDAIIITERGMRNYKDVKEFIEKTSLTFTNAALNNKVITFDGMEMLGFGPRSLKAALDISKIVNDTK